MLALAATLTTAGTATAEVGVSTPTAQAIFAKAAWLAYAPPPPVPGVVCLVDSGVDANPDTEAELAGSHELYPETGPGDELARLSPLVDGHPDGHGTLMAMLIAAPLNGWGALGIAPGADRVYDMKALAAGSVNFHDQILAAAINSCARLQESEYPAMRVINLSLGGEAVPEPSVASEVENAITNAKRQGIIVTAAAGNTGGPISAPAAYPGVVSVGAADAGGAPGTLCGFSARGADVLAPGCDTQVGGIEGAWQDTGEPNVSQGTSQADAIDSAVSDAMIAYEPTLTASQTENCITSTVDSGEIDAAAAFDACGLSSVVEAGTAAQPAPSPSAGAAGSNGQSSQTPGTVTVSCGAAQCSQSHQTTSSVRLESFERACPRPQIAHATLAKGLARVVTRRAVAGCQLQARLKAAHSRRWQIVRQRAVSALQFSAGRDARIQVRLSNTSGLVAPSAWMTIRPVYQH